MRLVVTSDTHHMHQKVKVQKGDILIHCGDFMGAAKNKSHFYDFLTWFGGQPHEHKIMIPGNHDGILEDGNRSELLDHIANLNITCMASGNKVIDGVNFGMYAYTNPFNNWFFQEYSDTHLAKLQPCDVLVSHGPSYGVLDANTDGHHCGSEMLRDWVLENRPMYHFHGHIHEAHGYAKLGETHVYNVSFLNANYKPKNRPTVIEL